MQENIDFVKNHLTSGIYKISAVSRAVFISRPTLEKIKKGTQVSPKVIMTLKNYFEWLGRE